MFISVLITHTNTRLNTFKDKIHHALPKQILQLLSPLEILMFYLTVNRQFE